jgi:hypothetical protein
MEGSRRWREGGRPLGQVARRLAVSTRALTRRLGEAGMTYRELGVWSAVPSGTLDVAPSAARESGSLLDS